MSSKQPLDPKILQEVKEIMAPIPHLRDGEFSRANHGKLYDEICRQLNDYEAKNGDRTDYIWEIGYEKGYEYPPDMFRDIGVGSEE